MWILVKITHASTVKISSLYILEAHTSRPVCTLECSTQQMNRRRIVAQGGDIPDPQSLYDKLISLDTSVEMFLVPEMDIESKPEVIVSLKLQSVIQCTP